MTKLASRSATVLLTAALLATPFVAFAQEAIMLETVGAVRMVSPEELQRRIVEPARPTEPRMARSVSVQTILIDRQTAAVR